MRKSASHTVDKGAKIFVGSRREYSLMVSEEGVSGRRLRQDDKVAVEVFKRAVVMSFNVRKE